MADGAWKPGPGRPPKESTGKAYTKQRRQLVKAGAPKLRWDATPAQKHEFCLQMEAEFQQTGSSRTKLFAKWATDLGCLPQTVMHMWDQRAVWQEQVRLAATRPAPPP